jgi:hypothetical protein
MAIWDYSPIKVAYDATRSAAGGDWRGAADALGRYNVPYQGAKKLKAGAESIYGDVKDAVNAPYDKAKEGFDVILGQLGNFKQERLKRKDDLYARANSQYDDTRNAMAQVYGDPRMWRL